jgi:hypothetical protein
MHSQDEEQLLLDIEVSLFVETPVHVHAQFNASEQPAENLFC